MSAKIFEHDGYQTKFLEQQPVFKNDQMRNAVRRNKDDKSKGPRDSYYDIFEFEKSCSENCLLIFIALESVPTAG